jgi:VIT1/CCC1 family predicted Fe2+/Mn2+ transporter
MLTEGSMSKATVATRAGIAAFVLVASIVMVWRLYPGQTTAWTIIAVSSALLLLEILGIIQTYTQRKETIDKVLRWVTGLNLVMLMSSLVAFTLTR